MLRVTSIVFVLLGIIGIASWILGINKVDQYYSHAAGSIGLVLLGMAGLTMDARQYQGGSPSIIAGIMAFLAITGIVSHLERYILYLEYDSSAVVVHGTLVIMSITLFIAGHKAHRMQHMIRTANKEYPRPSAPSGPSR